MAYQPKTPPGDPASLPSYLNREFKEIASVLKEGEIDILALAPLSVAPVKPRVGTVFYGTTDVGVVGAEGLRVYKSTGWALV